MHSLRLWFYILIVVSICVGFVAVDLGDFDTFYAAGQAVLHGINPYTLPGYYSPLYVALAFAPLTLLPLSLAFHLYAGLTIFLYGIAFYLLTRRIGMTIALMFSPFPLMTAYYGNLEAWVLIGSVMTPWIGIWLVLAKPQMGLIIAALFVWLAFRCSVGRGIRLIVPVGAMYALSFMAGMWTPPPTEQWWGATPIAQPWNMALWPLGLIIGIPAALIALRKRQVDLALFAGPFISPYIGAPSSLAGVLPFLGKRWYTAAGAIVGAWIIVILWRMRIP